jgi:hypothetical protein
MHVYHMSRDPCQIVGDIVQLVHLSICQSVHLQTCQPVSLAAWQSLFECAVLRWVVTGEEAAATAAQQGTDMVTVALKRLSQFNERPFRDRVHLKLISKEYDQVTIS